MRTIASPRSKRPARTCNSQLRRFLRICCIPTPRGRERKRRDRERKAAAAALLLLVERIGIYGDGMRFEGIEGLLACYTGTRFAQDVSFLSWVYDFFKNV